MILKFYKGMKFINYIIFKMILGEIMVKGAKGAKVKVFFQGLPCDTCHFCIGL